MKVIKESRGKQIFLIVFALLILAPAGYGFIEKLMLFVLAMKHQLIGGFVSLPVVKYLIVSAGMVCLLIWAIKHGMFRNIENPKYDMLEREEELERLEAQARREKQ